MASQIIQTVFGAGADNGLALGNNDLVRPFEFGSNWSTIRIGLLCSMTPDGTSNILGAGLAIGACDYPRSYSTAQAFMCGLISSPGGTSAYTANSGNPYYDVPCYCAKIVGTTITYATFNRNIPVNTTSPARRSLIIVELSRTATQISTAHLYAGQTTDYTSSHMYQYIEQMTTSPAPTVGGVALTNQGAQTVAVPANEQGALARLNALNIRWMRDTLPFNIYELVIFRTA